MMAPRCSDNGFCGLEEGEDVEGGACAGVRVGKVGCLHMKMCCSIATGVFRQEKSQLSVPHRLQKGVGGGVQERDLRRDGAGGVCLVDPCGLGGCGGAVLGTLSLGFRCLGGAQVIRGHVSN